MGGHPGLRYICAGCGKLLDQPESHPPRRGHHFRRFAPPSLRERRTTFTDTFCSD